MIDIFFVLFQHHINWMLYTFNKKKKFKYVWSGFSPKICFYKNIKYAIR